MKIIRKKIITEEERVKNKFERLDLYLRNKPLSDGYNIYSITGKKIGTMSNVYGTQIYLRLYDKERIKEVVEVRRFLKKRHKEDNLKIIIRRRLIDIIRDLLP